MESYLITGDERIIECNILDIDDIDHSKYKIGFDIEHNKQLDVFVHDYIEYIMRYTHSGYDVVGKVRLLIKRTDCWYDYSNATIARSYLNLSLKGDIRYIELVSDLTTYNNQPKELYKLCKLKKLKVL